MSVEARNLCFSYGKHHVLENISFSAGEGEFLSVLGPNGVGKTTLFRCLLGLLAPDSGSVYIDGVDIATMTASKLAQHVAYIPQAHAPAFNFTVRDMVLMGTTAGMGLFANPQKAQKEQADAALEQMGLLGLKDRGCASISGGERQLVLIARAIAQQAKILIMDEPSANLDFGNKIRVMDAVQRLSRSGYTVIQSTHDPEQAYRYSDRIMALYNGSILALDSPKKIIAAPLISKLYGIDVEVCSLYGDSLRVCIPAKTQQKGVNQP